MSCSSSFSVYSLDTLSWVVLVSSQVFENNGSRRSLQGCQQAFVSHLDSLDREKGELAKRNPPELFVAETIHRGPVAGRMEGGDVTSRAVHAANRRN